MSKQVKRRRGTTVEHDGFAGALGEITIDTTLNTAVVHDGSTTGGYPLGKADASNIDLTNKINTNELATSDGNAGDVLQTDGSGQVSFVAPGGITANSVGVIELETSDGLAGTVLTTDGAGTLSFVAPSIGIDELELVDGTSGHVITTDGAGTITFETVDGSMIGLGSDTQGDMMYYDGSAWVRLAKGTAEQALVINAGATAPEWGEAGQAYDIRFTAGFNSSMVKENVAVRTYDETIMARAGTFVGEVGYIDTAATIFSCIKDFVIKIDGKITFLKRFLFLPFIKKTNIEF